MASGFGRLMGNFWSVSCALGTLYGVAALRSNDSWMGCLRNCAWRHVFQCLDEHAPLMSTTEVKIPLQTEDPPFSNNS